MVVLQYLHLSRVQVTTSPCTNPIAGFECSLDGGSYSSCAKANPATINFDDLAAGQQHTVKIRAVDTQGNKDPNPDTFSWTILTPKQAIQKLIATIDSMHLSKGTRISLEATLTATVNLLNRHLDVAACNTLTAFIHQVDANQAIGRLTSQQAAELENKRQLYKMNLDALLPLLLYPTQPLPVHHSRPVSATIYTWRYSLIVHLVPCHCGLGIKIYVVRTDL